MPVISNMNKYISELCNYSSKVSASEKMVRSEEENRKSNWHSKSVGERKCYSSKDAGKKTVF